MVSQHVASCVDQLFCRCLFDFSIAPCVDINNLYFNVRVYSLCAQCECIDTDLNFCVRMSRYITQFVALGYGCCRHTAQVSCFFHGSEEVFHISRVLVRAREVQECYVVIITGVSQFI